MLRRLVFGLLGSMILALAAVGGYGLWASARPVDRPPVVAPAAPDVCGGFSLVASPNNTPTANYLSSVAAVGSNDVWAVGYFSYGNFDQTLAEHWNGTAWSVSNSSNANGGGNRLNGVAVVGASDVWAAGAYYNGSNVERTLTEHWDGSSWSIATSANQGTSNNQLNAVAAVGTSDVWVVGYYNAGLYNQTLVEHWNGTTWSVVASPNPGTHDNYLYAVTAVATNDVWAAGYSYNTGTSLYETLIEHWNGTAWSVVTSANVTGDNNYLAGISASGASDIWAVGQHFGVGSNQTLALHWDGSAWAVVSSPNVGSGDNRLYGIVARSSTDAWADGYANDSGTQPLAVHWDGSAWSVVASDTPSTGGQFYGMAAVAAADVWAVGFSGAATLVEHDTGPCPPTPTPPPTQTPGGPTATRTPPPTQTPGGPTATPVPSQTPCTIHFSDVQLTDYFYGPVTYLYCHGVIAGYGDGTFRPYSNSTRGQMVKIVVLGFNKPIQTPAGGAYTFQDVPPANPFFAVIETGAATSIVSGYGCGGPSEPCMPPLNRPYFRPNANVTRGQLSKIDVVAAGWTLLNPASRTFEDVLPGTAFYQFVETAAARAVVSGYACGGVGEPCGTPARPYFRQGANATRGQIAKIVYLSILSPLR